MSLTIAPIQAAGVAGLAISWSHRFDDGVEVGRHLMIADIQIRDLREINDLILAIQVSLARDLPRDRMRYLSAEECRTVESAIRTRREYLEVNGGIDGD